MVTKKTLHTARIYTAKLSALVLLVTQLYAVTAGPELPDPGKAPLTRQQQIQLGFQAAAQVYKQMPVLPDNSPETQYIRQLGQKLVAVIPQQYSWPFEFHVIPQKEINAFALPGGPMFVNVGAITAASNEAELAGVMAHEMSHVYMQHSAKQAGKQQTTAMVAGIVGAILGTRGMLGQLAQAGVQFGAQGLVLHYSRDDESQADAVGAIIMYKAGYNPQALADFFQKLATQGGAPPQFLSDHPNPGNREAAIQHEIANWPPKTYQTNSAAFERVRQQAAGLQVYTAEQIAQGAKSGQWSALNQKSGAVFTPPPGVAVSAPASATSAENASAPQPVALQSVLPSSRMVAEDLGPLSISHPDNWQVMAPTQKGEDVRIAPQAGVTGNAVGYGVLLNGIKPNMGKSVTIDQLTSQLVRAMQSGDSELQPVGSTQTITVAGAQGRSLDMQTRSPFPDANGQPQQERDWLVTVQRKDGAILYFVFVAPQSQYNQFKPTFDAMLRSIKLQQ
jgi:Zn-dependent protease with chaperone function